MKKVILSLVVVAVLSTASCKKNYTCTCTTTFTGGTSPNVTTTTTIDNTKSKATTACNGLASSVAGVASTTCSI